MQKHICVLNLFYNKTSIFYHIQFMVPGMCLTVMKMFFIWIVEDSEIVNWKLNCELFLLTIHIVCFSMLGSHVDGMLASLAIVSYSKAAAWTDCDVCDKWRDLLGRVVPWSWQRRQSATHVLPCRRIREEVHHPRFRGNVLHRQCHDVLCRYTGSLVRGEILGGNGKGNNFCRCSNVPWRNLECSHSWSFELFVRRLFVV